MRPFPHPDREPTSRGIRTHRSCRFAPRCRTDIPVRRGLRDILPYRRTRRPDCSAAERRDRVLAVGAGMRQNLVMRFSIGITFSVVACLALKTRLGDEFLQRAIVKFVNRLARCCSKIRHRCDPGRFELLHLTDGYAGDLNKMIFVEKEFLRIGGPTPMVPAREGLWAIIHV